MSYTINKTKLLIFFIFNPHQNKNFYLCFCSNGQEFEWLLIEEKFFKTKSLQTLLGEMKNGNKKNIRKSY